MHNLFLLYSTTNNAEASIIKGMLEENGITVFMMNKQDSSYVNFGQVEIYVPLTFKDLALNLLNKSLMN